MLCVLTGAPKQTGESEIYQYVYSERDPIRHKWKHVCGCSPLKTCTVFCFNSLCGLYWSWRRTISNVKLFFAFLCVCVQVPERFIEVSEVALREFYSAIWTGRDSDPCWKKGIYKIICKLDSPVPDAFRLPGCPVGWCPDHFHLVPVSKCTNAYTENKSLLKVGDFVKAFTKCTIQFNSTISFIHNSFILE